MPSYQEDRFIEIADAIREKENSRADIPAVDFAKRIRALSIGDSGKTSTITFTHTFPTNDFVIQNAYLAYLSGGVSTNEKIFKNNANRTTVTVNNGLMALFLEGNSVIHDAVVSSSNSDYVRAGTSIGVNKGGDVAFNFTDIHLKKEIPSGTTVTVTIRPRQ